MLRDGNRAAQVWLVGLLTSVLLLWYWGGFRLAYKDLASWEERTIARFIIIVCDNLLWFVLVNISWAYYFALFGLFGQVFCHLPIRYAATAIILLTPAIIFEQLADTGETFSLMNSTVWPFLFMGKTGQNKPPLQQLLYNAVVWLCSWRVATRGVLNSGIDLLPWSALAPSDRNPTFLIICHL